MGEILATIYRATASPRRLSDGVAVTVRFAGGGNRCPYRFGGVDYRSGLQSIPRFSATVEWTDKGWTGGVQPQSGDLIWYPSMPSDYTSYAKDYLWTDAPITIEAGDEGPNGEEPTAWSTVLVGNVAGATADGGAITLTVADLSQKLDKPLVTATFAGTGGVEGPVEARGRPKRRSWGSVFNVEGRILDKAYNIYEFGDPSFQAVSFDTVRDMGRSASPTPTVLGWQGSVAATFTALQAATPVPGSAVVAPSIQCVKWWTQPAGPLTADMTGESPGAGAAATLAQAILASVGGGLTITNAERDACNTARPGNCGVHVGDDKQTIASTLDQLFLGVSTIWVSDLAGAVKLRPISFTSPATTLRSVDRIERTKVYPPHKSRRLGYKRNNRQHNDGEISAALQFSTGSGGNRVWYSRWEALLQGWQILYNPTPIAISMSVAVASAKSYLTTTATFTAGGQAFAVGSSADTRFRIPVNPSERLAIAAQIAISGVSVNWYFRFQTIRADGSPASIDTIASGTGSVPAGTLLSGFVKTPADGVNAILYLDIINASGGAGSSTVNILEPLVVGVGDGATDIPLFTPGPSNEPAADVTASIVVPTSAEIAYDYTGATFQSAEDIVAKVQTAIGTVTSGVTLTWTVESGSFNGKTSADGPQALTLTSGVGSLTPTALATSTATLIWNATYNGRILPQTKTVLTKALAIPPAGGAGGSGGGGTDVPTKSSGFPTLNSATYTSLGVVTFTLPAGKTTLRQLVNLTAKMLPKSANQTGPWDIQFKLQRGGVDVGTAQNSAPDPYINVDTEIPTSSPGTMYYQLDTSGLTSGVQYTVELFARIASGTLPTTPGGVGLNFTGSIQLSAP